MLRGNCGRCLHERAETGICPGERLSVQDAQGRCCLYHPKTAAPDDRTDRQLPAGCKSLLLRACQDNCSFFVLFLECIGMRFRSCCFNFSSVETAFFFGIVFPPPTAGTKVFAFADGTCTRLAAYAHKAAVVQ